MRKIGGLTVTTPTEREIRFERYFDVPRQLLFDALTKPDLLEKWFPVPPNWKLQNCLIDLRPGGTYAFVLERPSGMEKMRGTFWEVDPPHRIVATDFYPGICHLGEALVTLTLEEEGEGTRAIALYFYPSQEDRDYKLSQPRAEAMATFCNALQTKLLFEMPGRHIIAGCKLRVLVRWLATIEGGFGNVPPRGRFEIVIRGPSNLQHLGFVTDDEYAPVSPPNRHVEVRSVSFGATRDELRESFRPGNPLTLLAGIHVIAYAEVLEIEATKWPAVGDEPWPPRGGRE